MVYPGEKMKLLITGASGFIGTKLKNRLDKKYEVIGQCRDGTHNVDDLSLFAMDIASTSNWHPYLEGVDTIVHLAAIAHRNFTEIELINEVNVEGTVNLARQAIENGVRRFVFISSIGVLGNCTDIEPFNELSNAAAHSPYAISKLKAEIELLALSKSSGLELVIIRPVLVYGSGAPGNFSKLVKLVKLLPFLPFALCKNKRSFISVDNLVDFISVCIVHPKAKNEIFCISDGDDLSIKDFTNNIAKGLSKNIYQLPIPVFILRLIGRLIGKSTLVEQLVGNLQVDTRKAKSVLGWTPVATMSESLAFNNKKK